MAYDDHGELCFPHLGGEPVGVGHEEEFDLPVAVAVVDQQIGGDFVDYPLLFETEEYSLLLPRHGTAVPLAEVVAERGRAWREAAAYVADGGEHGLLFAFAAKIGRARCP